MKTTIKFVLCAAMLFVCTNLFAQEQERHKPNLKPYCEFAPDSIAYLMANWGSGGFNYYLNHPVKDVLEDVEIPFKTIKIWISDYDQEMYGFSLFVQSLEQLNIVNEVVRERPFTIQLIRGIEVQDGELYQKITDGHKKSYCRPFDDELRKLIEPLMMENVHY